MPLNLTSLTIQDEFGNAVTDFSLCNLGDKLVITYGITADEHAISDVDNAFILNYTPSMIGSNWCYDPRGQFANFKIGDTIQRYEYTTNSLIDTSVRIVDKLDNYHIQLSVNLGLGNDVVANTSVWQLTKPVTCIKYNWNFIENSASNNYLSKVDGSLQLLQSTTTIGSPLTSGVLVANKVYKIVTYVAGDNFANLGAVNITGNFFIATGTTPTTWTNGSTLVEYSMDSDMQFIGNKPYQIGGATIIRNGLDTNDIFGQKFIITHTTYFTPFFLSDQWTNLVAGINAPYYLNGECLKNVFKFEALYLQNDPNRSIVYESANDINYNLNGNTGGFGESFNSGLSNYYIDSVTYPTSTLELSGNDTACEIIIKNTADTPFSNNNTKFTLNFIRAPYDASEYQGNNKTLKENFCFDRKHNTVGSAAANGDNYGTIWQVLKDVEGEYISPSEIKIKFKVSFASNVISEISASEEYRYMFFVAVQNHLLTSGDSDRVTLLADLNTFYVNSTDTTMIVNENLFIEHPNVTGAYADGIPYVNTCVEDEVVALSRFYVDKNGREDDSIVITSINFKIIALNTDNNDEFTLDSYSVNTASLPIINGNQYINSVIPRSFHIPSTEIRKNIQIIRNTSLDAGGKYYYDVVFPFMVRWEYWLSLANVNGDFFDVLEPKNGLNNEWFKYANELFATWNCYYELTINATKNGIPQQYKTRSLFNIDNYRTITGDFINSYDLSSNELVNGGTKYILGYDDTILVANFESPVIGDLADYCIVFGIEPYENGGVDIRRRFSSINETLTDTYFKSSDVIGLVEMADTGTGIQGICKIDKNLIPTNIPRWKVSARLYKFGGKEPEFRITEDGIFRETENSIYRITEP